jgi:hypothetical protein
MKAQSRAAEQQEHPAIFFSSFVFTKQKTNKIISRHAL